MNRRLNQDWEIVILRVLVQKESRPSLKAAENLLAISLLSFPAVST